MISITELDLDGREVREGILLIGKTTLREGKWVSLANVYGALCLVQLRVSMENSSEHPELDAFYCAACKGTKGHGPYCPWATKWGR